jgi:tetratricopeptide (TPR) repeat protein
MKIPLPYARALAQLAAANRARLAERLAQALQSATDACSLDELDALLGEVEPWLAEPRDRSDYDLRALGAHGRTLAAAGRYDEALVALRAAIDGWFGLRAESQASIPLCEYLRVLALRHGSLGDERDARRLAAVAGKLDPVSTRWLRLAVGRALVISGRPREALEQLGDPERDPWTDRDGPAAARLRWIARASAGDRGRRARRALDQHPSGDSLQLARLDDARAAGNPARIAAEVERLRSLGGTLSVQIERLLEVAGRLAKDPADVIADHFLD